MCKNQGNMCFSSNGCNIFVFDLKGNKFSLIIDKSTNLSTTKYLVFIVRFYERNILKTQDKFLCQLEIKDNTAQGIYSSLVYFFDSNGISLENFIGFACDNTSVMVGGK